MSEEEIKVYADECIKWEDEHNQLCTTSDKCQNTKSCAQRLQNIISVIP